MAFLRWLWGRLPVSQQGKQRLKKYLFSRIPFLYTWTRSYCQRETPGVLGELIGPNEMPSPSGKRDENHACRQLIPPIAGAPIADKPARLICFYLPQFHPIPENDTWWGKGFTEWKNVQSGNPQFVGHNQPRTPGALGQYSLLDPSVQRLQVELARHYGVGGFCFYFYWFGGTRLLETPIENYVKDLALDLPFCLCWANENWTRRWDGLESEILIAQNHSPEDDLAFIEHVARYLRDSRYICVDGKPLLVVYRPSLLPSPKDTARRWRNWCRENGIGEIYLAYTQSFEKVDPAKYGFDAAIEFPPNNSRPPDVTDRVTPLGKDFSCTVYDWRALVERSRQYKRPGYTLFRGVCPGWDNTARRRNRATIFVNSSPRGYQEWLFNAIADTRSRFADPDKQLIFVNAWNEWAEGAYLEPDQRNGYAYLEATRLALVRASLASASREIDPAKPLAIVIHAYYEEVFDEILHYTKRLTSVPFKLYVTCPNKVAEGARARLESTGHEFDLLPLPNRGRDSLPFLKMMQRVVAGGHDMLVKVHTKKSAHRKDGHEWRRDLFDRLLTDPAIRAALEQFCRDPACGVLGPDGHVVSLTAYIGSNDAAVRRLSERLGLESERLGDVNFVAGSMYFARIAALVPLINIALSDEDFEEEQGQIDGAMAHAIERVIPVSAWAAGFTTRSVSGSLEASSAYPFADSSVG